MIPTWVQPETVEVPVREDSKGLVEVHTYNPDEGVGLNVRTAHAVAAVDLEPEDAERLGRALIVHADRVRRFRNAG